MVGKELIIDNFAGGGGTSTGLAMAGLNVDIAVNHDPSALRLHTVNHPETIHLCEDVWAVDPVKVCRGFPVALAWFSPDCKHFSKAKGGKPLSKKIRGLAWVTLKWAALVRPRVIILENVEEFETWGPLNRNGHPIKGRIGETFRKFTRQLKELGYHLQHKNLVVGDYGTPTLRKRFVLIARCDGKPIVWPERTHAPLESDEVKEGRLQPYTPIYSKIDMALPFPSVFETAGEIRKTFGLKANRPLAPQTMQRISSCIKEFMNGTYEPFMIEVNHSSPKRRVRSLREPMPTITAKHGFGIVDIYLKSLRDPNAPFVSSMELLLQSVGTPHDFGSIRRKDHSDLVRALVSNSNGPTDGNFEITSGIVYIGDVPYQIVDVGLRMFEPKELYSCQGFPSNYIIDRDCFGKMYPRNEQVKRCGNAVPPQLAKVLAQANLAELCNGIIERTYLTHYLTNNAEAVYA